MPIEKSQKLGGWENLPPESPLRQYVEEQQKGEPVKIDRKNEDGDEDDGLDDVYPSADLAAIARARKNPK